MKVLLLTLDYPPIIKSSSRLFADLAEGIKGLGYNVTVLTSTADRYLSFDQTRRMRIYKRERINQIEIHRLSNLPIPRNIPLLRGIEHFILGFIYLICGLLLGQQDLIIVYSPPLPLSLTGYLLSRIRRGKVIINVQDLYPETVVSLGLLRSAFLISVTRRLADFLYKHADAITVHSNGNREHVISRGAKPEKVTTIYNWVDIDAYSVSKNSNDFRKTHDVRNAFLVSYGGIMGFAQGLEIVLQTANLLRGYKDIVFFLVGDGVMKPKLKAMASELDLPNVFFLNMLEPAQYQCLLKASDACLVTLSKDLITPVVPGKLQSIMAAGRPIICCTNKLSDIVSLVQEADCGICVDPESPDDMAHAILDLYNDPRLAEGLGQKGWRYASQHFEKSNAIHQYKKLIKSLI